MRMFKNWLIQIKMEIVPTFLDFLAISTHHHHHLYHYNSLFPSLSGSTVQILTLHVMQSSQMTLSISWSSLTILIQVLKCLLLRLQLALIFISIYILIDIVVNLPHNMIIGSHIIWPSSLRHKSLFCNKRDM